MTSTKIDSYTDYEVSRSANSWQAEEGMVLEKGRDEAQTSFQNLRNRHFFHLAQLRNGFLWMILVRNGEL